MLVHRNDRRVVICFVSSTLLRVAMSCELCHQLASERWLPGISILVCHFRLCIPVGPQHHCQVGHQDINLSWCEHVQRVDCGVVVSVLVGVHAQLDDAGFGCRCVVESTIAVHDADSSSSRHAIHRLFDRIVLDVFQRVFTDRQRDLHLGHCFWSIDHKSVVDTGRYRLCQCGDVLLRAIAAHSTGQ